MKQKLNHLAIIMDGNARWAKLNNKTKAGGYKKGAEVAKSLIPHLSRLEIKYLTLYTFSSENWQRPQEEVSILLDLLSKYILNDTEILSEHGIRLKVIGNLERLSPSLKKEINDAVISTAHNTQATICIAFSYGSREEIIHAYSCALAEGETKITEDNFRNFLYDPEMPDVDLLIRTGNVYRISNFLLWQLAYAELYFLGKFWPEFGIDDLEQAIAEYSTRRRNFGRR